jgi:hypothetical protein
MRFPDVEADFDQLATTALDVRSAGRFPSPIDNGSHQCVLGHGPQTRERYFFEMISDEPQHGVNGFRHQA